MKTNSNSEALVMSSSIRLWDMDNLFCSSVFSGSPLQLTLLMMILITSAFIYCLEKGLTEASTRIAGRWQ